MIELSIYTLLIFTVFFSWSLLLDLTGHFICKPFYKQKKLLLYPFFEYFIAVAFTILWINCSYFVPYFILLSALAITIQTDLTCMLISRFASLYLVPVGFIAAHFGCLPISTRESIAASIISYGLFYLINKIYYLIKKQDGIGQGDLELMAFIGAYTGFLGAWFALLYGSILGLLSSIMIMLYQRKRITKIPLGAYLAIGSILFVIFQTTILHQLNCLF